MSCDSSRNKARLIYVVCFGYDDAIIVNKAFILAQVCCIEYLFYS